MTDKDYADLVDPYVRAEEEAERRGFWHGVVSTIWALLIVCILGGALYAGKVNAETIWQAMTWGPVKASECGGTISVCHAGEIEGRFLCYCVR